MKVPSPFVLVLVLAANVQATVINIKINEPQAVSLTESHDQELATHKPTSVEFDGQYAIEQEDDDDDVHEKVFIVECANPDQKSVSYGETYLKAEAQEGVRHLRIPGDYPKRFQNHGNFHMECPGVNVLYEWPIGSAPQFFDRVIFSASGAYCKTVTHRGMNGGAFRVCPNE